MLIVLGTPSTVATVCGEAFYYISQRAERAISFMPTAITDQRVIAVYFDRNRRVQRVAAYGIKDGRIFDFISRTTPTAGTDYNIISGSCTPSKTVHGHPGDVTPVEQIGLARAQRGHVQFGPIGCLSARAPRAAAAPRCW